MAAQHFEKHSERPVWIRVHSCWRYGGLMLKSSDDGAELHVLDASHLPAMFELGFSHDGGDMRHCRVAWRKDRRVGVDFVPRPSVLSHQF